MDSEKLKAKLAKLSKPVESGCIEWSGATQSNGYGRVKVDGRAVLAHRAAILLRDGAMPSSDLDVCHRCDNRKCINPDHLFVGTRSDNMMDASRKNRLPKSTNKRKYGPEWIPAVKEALSKTRSNRAAARLLNWKQTAIQVFIARYLTD